MLTSKAKYALRAMVDLAVHDRGGPIFIADIARRQDIPRRFLENILIELRRGGLVISHRGKNGGYALARPAETLTFAQIIRAIDGPLALAPCASVTAYRKCEDCVDEHSCTVRPALIAARDATALVLEQTTLAAAAKGAGKGLTAS